MKITKAEARRVIQAHNAIMGATFNTGLNMQLVVRASREELIRCCESAGISIQFEDESGSAFAFERS